MIMTRKERKSNESRLSNNIKRTATTVIITAAVVGSIGITNSVRAEEKDVRITSSDSVDTTGGSISAGESSSVSTSPISTNSITVTSIPKNKEESPKPEALTSNVGSESNSATIEDNSSDKLSIQGNTFDSRNPLSNGGVTINKDKEPDRIKLEPYREKMTEEKKKKLIDDALKELEKLKDLPEEKRQTVKDNIGGDKVGTISLEELEENLKSILERAKQQDELARKEKEKNNNPKSNKETENGKIDEKSDKAEPEKPKMPKNPSDPEVPKEDKEDKPSVKPKAEPKSPKEKKPEAKMPKENKPKIEEKKNENNSPEMKKPEMKSPQKDDMNKKGDSNKNKMKEAPKKENNKNRMSDKMNEAPKNIKKKMLPQMGIQHSIATSLMGLSSLVGAALILFKKNDK